jgi:hypothetical protein
VWGERRVVAVSNVLAGSRGYWCGDASRALLVLLRVWRSNGRGATDPRGVELAA